MTVKETKLSQRTHIWAHVAVIVFHILMAGMWILCTFRMSPGVAYHGWTITSYILASLMGIISLLGLIPILKKRHEILTITP